MRHSLVITLATAAVFTGCTTTKMGNVIPGENDTYQVISTGKSADAALASALYSADSTCKQRRLRHIVISHKTEYKGVVSGEAGQAIEKALEIVLEETGKKPSTVSSDNDYRTTMQFRCE